MALGSVSAMTTLILSIVVPLLIVAGIAFMVVRRGLQMRELCDHGVMVAGTVLRKLKRPGPGNRSRLHKLAYGYMDDRGVSHERVSVVPQSVWDAYGEGAPIEVVYSSKRTQVSAPRYLVEQCRQALAGRSGGQGPPA
jgi:hypothetical protein